MNLVSESLKKPLKEESMSELQLFMVNLVLRISDCRRLASVNMCSEKDFRDLKSWVRAGVLARRCRGSRIRASCAGRRTRCWSLGDK